MENQSTALNTPNWISKHDVCLRKKAEFKFWFINKAVLQTRVDLCPFPIEKSLGQIWSHSLIMKSLQLFQVSHAVTCVESEANVAATRLSRTRTPPRNIIPRAHSSILTNKAPLYFS